MSDFPTRLANVANLFILGSNDAYVREGDLEKQMAQMPEDTVLVKIPDYNHLDYLWAADATENVYSHIFNFLDGLSKS